ncbi:MAG: hypothetical protein WKI04_16065 [Ferruginibacter sp.]
MISNWTKDLTLFTNGKSTLNKQQAGKLNMHNIKIVETEIVGFEHQAGQIQNILFKEAAKSSIKEIYTRPPFKQHCDIPEKLGCELTEQGYIKIDTFQKTTVHGIFASDDHTTFMRSVSNSVAMETLSGAMTNKRIIGENF